MIKKSVHLVFIACLLSACETTSEGTGVVQNSEGSGIETVNFKVISSFGSNSANVEARFSTGELYTGKFVAATSETSTNIDFYDFDSDDDVFGSSSSTAYSSKATGVLFGTGGKAMQCAMTLAEPSLGFDGGAVGRCKTSTGQIIPMQLRDT